MQVLSHLFLKSLFLLPPRTFFGSVFLVCHLGLVGVQFQDASVFVMGAPPQVWSKRCAAFHASLGSVLAFGPVMEKMLQRVQNVSMSLEKMEDNEVNTRNAEVLELLGAVEEATVHMKDWRKGLRLGSTADIEKTMVSAMSKVTDSWMRLGSTAVADVTGSIRHWKAYVALLSEMGPEADLLQQSKT